MTRSASLLGYTVLAALVSLSNARFFSLLCLSGFQPRCPAGEQWDLRLCKCTPASIDHLLDTGKCSPPSCPLRFHAPRCIVYRKDSRGCPTCDCECDELSQICPVNCPSGTEMVTSSSGCKECRCKPSTICRPLECDNDCPFGRFEDSQGCPTCNCKPRRHVCPPVMCKEACPYGTFEDTNNCPTCICKPKPICPIRSCDNFCPIGREQDSNGCDVCKCRPMR